jgi:uncharacterized protein with GYD domain
MLFLQTARHSPESCPTHNDEAKKVFGTFTAKMESLTKKHGIKVVGSWVSMPEHLVVTVCDAPNQEAMLKYMMEPEVMAWSGYQVSETRPVLTLEEAAKFAK